MKDYESKFVKGVMSSKNMTKEEAANYIVVDVFGEDVDWWNNFKKQVEVAARTRKFNLRSKHGNN